LIIPCNLLVTSIDPDGALHFALMIFSGESAAPAPLVKNATTANVRAAVIKYRDRICFPLMELETTNNWSDLPRTTLRLVHPIAKLDRPALDYLNGS
jgi:hypothetical protein